MVEQFKEILEQLEPKLGKYKSVTALVENEYPSKCEGTYTGSAIWVEFENQWIMLYQGPDKWGEYYTKVGLSDTKTNDVWSCDEPDFDLEEILDEKELRIADLADEIYSSTHMFINRTINLKNITESDVLYMINCTKEVLEAKSLQETLKKGLSLRQRENLQSN